MHVAGNRCIRKRADSVLLQCWIVFELRSEQFHCSSEWVSDHRTHLSHIVLRSKALWFECEMSPPQAPVLDLLVPSWLVMLFWEIVELLRDKA